MEKISKNQFRELCRLSIQYEIVYCYLCGKIIKPGQRWNLDHVVPKSRGGATHYTNLKPVHCDCNTAKADKLLSEYRLMQERQKKR